MAALYDRYSAVVYSVALRVLGDTGAAEDVLQEVFMQLWRNPGLFDSSRGSLGPWLAVITRHRAIDGLRKRRPETDIADVVVSVEPDMAGEAERARAMEKVRGTLGSMPAAHAGIGDGLLRRFFPQRDFGQDGRAVGDHQDAHPRRTPGPAQGFCGMSVHEQFAEDLALHALGVLQGEERMRSRSISKGARLPP